MCQASIARPPLHTCELLMGFSKDEAVQDLALLVSGGDEEIS